VKQKSQNPNLFTVGILGGGQLARMTAYAALRLGFQVAIYERAAHSPASFATPLSFVGEWDNFSALDRFAAVSDVITLENEFVDANILAHLETLGKPVYPSSKTIALIQDKFIQKDNLAAHGLPVAHFSRIDSIHDAENFGAEHGYPFLLKARKGGYDGYGNRTVKSKKDISRAMKELGFPTKKLMAESFVNFKAELAVMVARNANGETEVYPVVETIQEHHICKIVKAPARVSPETYKASSNLAKAAIRAIDGVGIFGVELFLLKNGTVLINELAPRPHNSGHYTIEACTTSQFENHLRAVCGFPLGSSAMIKPAAVMVNYLGKRNASVSYSHFPAALKNSSAHLHIYGKTDSRIGRKMGHITAIGERVEDCLKNAKAMERKLLL
jgi:5-(carboxyamino)imidazole ribonucleotide synthase